MIEVDNFHRFVSMSASVTLFGSDGPERGALANLRRNFESQELWQTLNPWTNTQPFNARRPSGSLALWNARKRESASSAPHTVPLPLCTMQIACIKIASRDDKRLSCGSLLCPQIWRKTFIYHFVLAQNTQHFLWAAHKQEMSLCSADARNERSHVTKRR